MELICFSKAIKTLEIWKQDFFKQKLFANSAETFVFLSEIL